MLAVVKGCSSFGAIIVLVIGLIITGVTIYGYFHTELFFNEVSERNLILGIALGADFLVIFSSILGMCGIKKGSIGLLCIFQVFVIIFLFVFGALGIGCVLLPGNVFEGNCTTSKNPSIQYANEAYLVS